MQNNEIKEHASKICAKIIHTPSHLLGEKPLEDFSEKELTSLVDEEFRRCGLNLILVGSLSDLGKISIPLQLETKATLHSLDEVKDLLKIQVEKYISDLEKNCQACKRHIYDLLLEYQDKQKRKKKKNPF